MAAFSVQDAQSQRLLPVENSPAPLCSISMGGKGGGYTYYIEELPPSKPVGFDSSLWEGANPLRLTPFARFPLLSLHDIFPRPGEVFPLRGSCLPSAGPHK